MFRCVNKNLLNLYFMSCFAPNMNQAVLNFTVIFYYSYPNFTHVVRFYYSYACFVSLPDEDWYIQSKICLLNLTQLDSCLVQNMTLNTDYNAVDASFKPIKSPILHRFWIDLFLASIIRFSVLECLWDCSHCIVRVICNSKLCQIVYKFIDHTIYCKSVTIHIYPWYGQGRSVRGGMEGHVPPQSPRWGGTGGAPTGGRLLYKTAFWFNRLEVNVLYEVYWL